MATRITSAETAKLIRNALKAKFPGIKFSVRCSRGYGIRIEWLDGPTVPQVKTVTADYKSGGFDGMIDMAYNTTSWLMPDGTVKPAKSSGTTGQMGMHEAYDYPQPHPKAALVTFGNDTINYDRSHSAGLVKRSLDSIARKWGGFDPEALEIVTRDDGSAWPPKAGSIMVERRGWWLDMMLHEELSRRTNYVPQQRAAA